MQLGMIGLGRMGANMVRRLMRAGHECVVYDVSADAIATLEAEGATGARTMEEFAAKLTTPRATIVMVPAAVVDDTLAGLVPHFGAGDVIIDGGNSYYRDDIRRSEELAPKGIEYMDMGTSGGTHGLERGYCLMIGGPDDAFARLEPVFEALAPGVGEAPPTPGRDKPGATADKGYLHCGKIGAGHFVKMVHNGIEYGIMAAYAEGFNVLKHADAGRVERTADAETAPLGDPHFYDYDLDLGEIAELWRRGSVVGSWLLDLTALSYLGDPNLEAFKGSVSDSGEGRWTAIAAIEEGVPIPVLNAALFERFASQGADDHANRVLNAMRFQFGGHHVKPSA
jgi:6-phosphogluconate dehydrogenase